MKLSKIILAMTLISVSQFIVNCSSGSRILKHWKEPFLQNGSSVLYAAAVIDSVPFRNDANSALAKFCETCNPISMDLKPQFQDTLVKMSDEIIKHDPTAIELGVLAKISGVDYIAIIHANSEKRQETIVKESKLSINHPYPAGTDISKGPAIPKTPFNFEENVEKTGRIEILWWDIWIEVWTKDCTIAAKFGVRSVSPFLSEAFSYAFEKFHKCMPQFGQCRYIKCPLPNNFEF